MSYQVAYGVWSKPGATRGVFVTGTDTGIGKTLVSSVLVRAWQADYWKPLQTGVSEEPGDTETVAVLADLPASRRHAPHAVLQAALSPWAAAMEEGVAVDMAAIALPATSAPLVVEGAGGLLVPINDTAHMIDLAAQLALPVVLVARSVLGTINHTLLSLEALRARPAGGGRDHERPALAGQSAGRRALRQSARAGRDPGPGERGCGGRGGTGKSHRAAGRDIVGRYAVITSAAPGPCRPCRARPAR